MRDQRGWKQEDLASHAGMLQEAISRLEDPSYAKLTLKTLKKLASGFDVGLMVRFVSLDELVELELKSSPDSLKALSYDENPYFKEKPEKNNIDLQLPGGHAKYDNIIEMFPPAGRPTVKDEQKMPGMGKQKEPVMGELFNYNQPTESNKIAIGAN